MNQTVSSVEAALGPWDALDYPNIRAVPDATDADLAATPRQTLGMLLFTIHAIRDFERWLLDHADLVHGPLHSSIGQEAVAAGMALALAGSDGLTSTHRAHHDVLAKLIGFAAPADFDPLAARRRCRRPSRTSCWRRSRRSWAWSRGCAAAAAARCTWRIPRRA